MFTWFLPRAQRQVLEEAQLIYESLKRNRIYAQDLLSENNLNKARELESRYKPLRKAGDIAGLKKWNAEVLKTGTKIFPPSPWDAWRENVEVFVVAAIMALAIRSFFLQPFKIPTGSMEPTLYGIEPVPAQVQPPNLLVRAFDFIIFGRSYSRVVTQQGGQVVELTKGQWTIWFEYTDVHLRDALGNEEVDRIWIRLVDVERKLGILPGRVYNAGDVLTNCVIQTGDQVLVDKVTYNFRAPRRGDVIIFKTSEIPYLDNERQMQDPTEEGTPVFIKRCVALGGDTVTINPPYVLVNGKLADGSPVFSKQFQRCDSYPGYTTIADAPLDSNGHTQTFQVPPGMYWAMGDNSPNSEDSRYWGGVPPQNMVGRGYIVFWPFSSRWGWIP